MRTDGGVLTGPASAQRDQQLDDLEAQVRARLAQPDLAGRRAGIVLSFGVADEPGPGRQRAGSIIVNIYPLVDADHGPLGPQHERVC